MGDLLDWYKQTLDLAQGLKQMKWLEQQHQFVREDRTRAEEDRQRTHALQDFGVQQHLQGMNAVQPDSPTIKLASMLNPGAYEQIGTPLGQRYVPAQATRQQTELKQLRAKKQVETDAEIDEAQRKQPFTTTPMLIPGAGFVRVPNASVASVAKTIQDIKNGKYTGRMVTNKDTGEASWVVDNLENPAEPPRIYSLGKLAGGGIEADVAREDALRPGKVRTAAETAAATAPYKGAAAKSGMSAQAHTDYNAVLKAHSDWTNSTMSRQRQGQPAPEALKQDYLNRLDAAVAAHPNELEKRVGDDPDHTPYIAVKEGARQQAGQQTKADSTGYSIGQSVTYGGKQYVYRGLTAEGKMRLEEVH